MILPGDFVGKRQFNASRSHNDSRCWPWPLKPISCLDIAPVRYAAMKIVTRIAFRDAFHLNPLPDEQYLITPSAIAETKQNQPRGRGRNCVPFINTSLPREHCEVQYTPKASNNLASHTILEITLGSTSRNESLVDYLNRDYPIK